MKRPRKYMHRPGMRFDRRHVQGPDAGFLGGEIEITTFTGSVERSLTQQSGRYEYPTVPFAGYPRTAGEMNIACGGKGEWVDGFLCEEAGPGITSSFNPVNTLSQTGTGISYRLVGFRGPADDFAVGLSTASMHGLGAASSASYALSSGSDIGLLWVAQQSTLPGAWSFRLMFSKADLGSPSSGYFVTQTSLSTNPPGVASTLFVSDGESAPQIDQVLPLGQWYVGLFCVDRSSRSGSYAVLNLETGQFRVSRNVMPTGSNQGGNAGKFTIGNQGAIFTAPSMTVSALYIASGTNAAQGFVGNEESLLRSFAQALKARDGFRFSGSLEIDRSLSAFGTSAESSYINQQLLGLGTASLGRARGVTIITTGSIPSWTNSHIRNSAFVVPTLSSSNHESQVLGYYFSGTEPLESTSVPASSSLYYAKTGKYRHVVVKKTASVEDLSPLPNGMDGFTPVYYVPGKGTDVTTVTGTLSYSGGGLVSSDIRRPCLIPIDVPYSGKIVDIKVWVELMSASGSGANLGNFPLGTLAIAIRSPNVRGFHAHPIRNDEILRRVFTSELTEFAPQAGAGAIRRSLYGPDYISPFYRDTFILWEGSAPGYTTTGHRGPWDLDFESVDGITHYHSQTSKYPSWQRDRSMRTVFSDGASVPNPRHHYASPSASYVGSPNSYLGYNNAYGFDVPWTSETEISGANTYVIAGSPPAGWLSGPGGTNQIDEWPTTGVNYGADYIKPLYPLLDPLYQRKRYNDDYVRVTNLTGSSLFDPDKWTGFRPGLKGTEASGTWYLVIGSGQVGLGDIDPSATTYSATIFRQVRLEFILESGSIEPQLRKQSKLRARRAKNEFLVHSISGSDYINKLTGSWDNFISDTYVYTGDDGLPEVGRTFGVTFLTGSAESGDYALYYRLTGSLADLSGTTPGWLLSNEFGMPQIPLSSASLIEPKSVPIVGMHPQDILAERPLFGATVRVAEAAKDVNAPTTRAEAYEAILTSLNEEED